MPKITLSCVVCHRAFERFPSQLQQAPKYCSRQCQGVSKQRRIDLACDWCGALFTRVVGEVRAYRKRTPLCFCSRRCAIKSNTSPAPSTDLFWSNVTRIDDDTACWVYRHRQGRAGYGVIKVNGTPLRAHRFSWELHYGAIPDGLMVCHRCDNPPCVRPDHLFLGTAAINSADMVAKGRSYTPSGDNHYSRRFPNKVRRGDAAPRSVLREEQIPEIRQRAATGQESLNVIARAFGVSPSNIGAIVRGQTWKHLPVDGTHQEVEVATP